MQKKNEKIEELNAYEVLHHQTQSLINVLYLLVMCIMPLLWFGDCKRTMSLLFKNIQMPDYLEEHETMVDFHPNVQMLIIMLAIGAYGLHRNWRLRSHHLRAELLKQETSFTETRELHNLKQKLLDKINTIIEDKISTPLKQFTPLLSARSTQASRSLEGIREEETLETGASIM